jgi:hypothetical protein
MSVAEFIPGKPTKRLWRVVLAWLGLLALLCAVVGALGSLFWSMVVTLPQYQILDDLSASISERGLVEIVAVDAWYVIIGLLIGPGIGYVAWRWFKPLGWPVAVIAAAAGVFAGAVCWWCGGIFAPGSFNDRLAIAKVGELVPVALDLRATSALWVWPFAAVAPILIITCFAPDPESEPAS